MKTHPLPALAALWCRSWLLILLVPLLAACTSGQPVPPASNAASTVTPISGDRSSATAPPGASEASLFATVLAAASPTPVQPITPAAAAYLEAALMIMQQNALHRSTIDWPTLRAHAASLAQRAQTSADTYPAIRFALAALGDRHSFLLPPNEVTALQSGQRDSANALPSGEVLDDTIGYIRLPAFVGSEQAATAYAIHVQELVRELDGANPCGWIVDLSDNGGGNMWPMLAGIGPILGEGLVGAFVGADGQTETWFYHDGQAGVDNQLMIQLPSPAYHRKQSLPVVAILTNGITASSGEAIAIAFRGRPNARSFGASTRGLSTSNATHRLSDRAMIVLTERVDADRTGQRYGDALAPDEPIADSTMVRPAALAWLHAQPACMP
jgi:carboxyl-terminal processing protease